jgi:hypothetical protein
VLTKPACPRDGPCGCTRGARDHPRALSLRPHPLIPALLLALAALAAILCGCADQAPHFATLPPCATIQRETGSHPHAFRGQGLWIGNRILTAAHVLMPGRTSGDPTLTRSVYLNGEATQVLAARTGDLATAARLYSSSALPTPSDWLEDWAVAEVSRTSSHPSELRVARLPIPEGQTMYIVGFDPASDPPQLRAIPMRVLRASIDGRGPLPERLIAARAPSRQDLRGWSGAFVGRYDSATGKWEYVGMLVMTLDTDPPTHLVLRPPPEGIEHLLSDASPDVHSGEAKRTSTPEINPSDFQGPTSRRR